MPSTTTIRVTDSVGNFLFETAQFLEAGDSPGLRYVLSCGLVGALVVTLPPEFNSKLPKDGRIFVMRSVNGGAAQREGDSCFLIRKWQFASDYTTVTALHVNSLMWTRHDLFGKAGYVEAFAEADDVLKTLWRSNAGDFVVSYRGQNSSAVSDNTQADLRPYVTTQANVTAGPVIGYYFQYLNVGDIIRTVCDASMLAGTYLTAEIVAPTESTLEFQTFTTQRGTDRRFSTGSGLLFTEARGNVANALLTVDATEEITFAFAGGANRDYSFNVDWSLDSTRMAESVFGRRELFVDAGNANDANSVSGAADAGVRGGRPIIQVTAELQETDQCIRGVHFDYGDMVTVEVQGIQYDMRLDVIEVSLQGGVESTRASFYADS